MRISSDQLIQPLVSEKSAKQESKFNEYTVVVANDMNKIEISKAVEKMFGVKPLSVRTSVFRKKGKKTKHGYVSPKVFKKALLRLPDGKRLEIK